MNYLDKLKHLHQHPDTNRTIQAGVHIAWTRGDLTVQHGMVDFVHVDEDGIAWAFVTLGESWAVVNMKFTARFEDLES